MRLLTVIIRWRNVALAHVFLRIARSAPSIRRRLCAAYRTSVSEVRAPFFAVVEHKCAGLPLVKNGLRYFSPYDACIGETPTAVETYNPCRIVLWWHKQLFLVANSGTYVCLYALTEDETAGEKLEKMDENMC